MERTTSPLATTVVLALLVVLAPTSSTAGPAVAGGSTGGPAVAAYADRGPVGVTAAGPPVEGNDSPARLVLADYRVERAQFETVTIGTASTLQAGADGARAEHRRIAIERRFEAADDVSDERSVVDGALRGLNERAQALEARERAALRQYSEGDITTATMVRRLARIDARARELRHTLDLVERLTERIPTDDFDARIRDVGGLLAPLSGPVRQRVSRTLSGEATPVRVHVTTSDDGLVLSMLDSGQYVREATNWRNRNVSAPLELEFGDFGDIGDRVEELYPWVTSQTRNPSFEWQGSGAWRFEASHDQGELTAQIDASTADVYREVQRLDVQDMPASTTIVRTEEGLRIALRRTYPGGPLRILVEDAATDAVVNANVTVGNHRLGSIGADGFVMTLEPRLPYDVNVTSGGSSVDVTVRPTLNATTS